MRFKAFNLTLISINLLLLTAVNAAEYKEEMIAEATAFANQSQITIGDVVRYTIQIKAERGYDVRLMIPENHFGGFGVRDFGEDPKEKAGNNRFKKTFWYDLDTYTTGSYKIPAQEIRLVKGDEQRALKTPEVFIEVKSVLESKEDGQGLRDIKAVLIPKGSNIFWIVLTAVIFVILLISFLIFALRNKKSASFDSVIQKSADEIALDALESVQKEHLIEKGLIKEYYYKVSIILRSYIEDRFSIKAPESSTEEFIEKAMNSKSLMGNHINLLKEYLEHCDLVKYARFSPEKDQIEKIFFTTRSFIEDTKEKKAEVEK